MHRRDMERVAVECVIALERCGVTIEVVNDIERVRSFIFDLDGRVGAAIDPEQLLLTSGNSFWALAMRHGRPLAAIGVRVDDLGEDDAQAFLAQSVQVIFGVKVTSRHSDIFSGKKCSRWTTQSGWFNQ